MAKKLPRTRLMRGTRYRTLPDTDITGKLLTGPKNAEFFGSVFVSR